MSEYNIDDIMRKDASERTDDEIEFMIEWKAEQRFKEKEIKKAEAERRKAYERMIEEERRSVDESIAVMREMAEDARKRFEDSSNE